MEQALKAAKQLGLKWKVLDDYEEAFKPPPPPYELEYLWSMFIDLCTGRTGGLGPNPLQWTDIDAYSRVYGITFQHWELKAIKLLDALWMKTVGAPKNA